MVSTSHLFPLSSEYSHLPSSRQSPPFSSDWELLKKTPEGPRRIVAFWCHASFSLEKEGVFHVNRVSRECGVERCGEILMDLRRLSQEFEGEVEMILGTALAIKGTDLAGDQPAELELTLF